MSGGLATTLDLVNTASEGLLGVAILIIIFFIIFVRNRNTHPARESIVGGMHAVMILAIPLRFLHLIDDLTLGIIFVGWIGAIVMLTNRE
jgi:Na+/proline symporter